MEQDKNGITFKNILRFTDLCNQEVLEIGCGDGRITSYLIGKSKRLVAIDPNEDSISKAKKNIVGADFRIGSGEFLKFPSRSFDLVLFTLSLHHQDGVIALREARRVSRDDGQVLILEPLNDGEIQQICNLFHDESEALLNVTLAINESDFKIEHSEVFFTDWKFENIYELYDWFFNYYQISFNSRIVSQIGELLNDKMERQPIVLQDKILIACLRK